MARISLSSAAIQELDAISGAMLEKVALATNMKPTQLQKYSALEPDKKRAESAKIILKSTLINEDENIYRIRLQPNGGFSISMAGPAFDFAASLIRNTRLKDRYIANCLSIIPEEEHALFLYESRQMLDVYNRDRTFDLEDPHPTKYLYIVGKETNMYIRLKKVGFDPYDANEPYKELLNQTMFAINYVHRLKAFVERIQSINQDFTSLSETYTDISRLAFIPITDVRNQLENF